MADIRINALANTASSTASDDYLAVDGTTNGTRKLNAYSPTFGGNLTVSGTGTSSFGGNIRSGQLTLVSNRLEEYATDSDYSIAVSYVGYNGGTTRFRDFQIYDGKAGLIASFAGSSKLTTLSGNLTVSGTGTSSVAGNLGIRTSSPLVPLQVAAASGSAYPVQFTTNDFVNSSTGTRMLFGFTAASGNTTASIQANYDGGLTAAGLVLQPSGGNVLIGTTTDGGQKLQVSGTGYFSAGITIGGTSDVGTGGVLWQDAGSPYSTHLSGANLKFETGSNFARTTVLTLDSSQNATFAGTVTATVNKSTANYFRVDTLVAAGSTTTTIYTFSNVNTNRSWIISTRQQGSANNTVIGFATTYAGVLTVYRIAQSNTNPVLDMTYSASGLALQLVLGSGFGSTTWDTTITPLQG